MQYQYKRVSKFVPKEHTLMDKFRENTVRAMAWIGERLDGPGDRMVEKMAAGSGSTNFMHGIVEGSPRHYKGENTHDFRRRRNTKHGPEINKINVAVSTV